MLGTLAVKHHFDKAPGHAAVDGYRTGKCSISQSHVFSESALSPEEWSFLHVRNILTENGNVQQGLSLEAEAVPLELISPVL